MNSLRKSSETPSGIATLRCKSERERRGGSGRILLIDDDKGTRETLARLLQLEGYDAVTAESGWSGVGRAESQAFDLILCDLRLPDITGVEVQAELKKRGIGVPFVIMTRFPGFDSAFEAGASGAAAYIEGIPFADELIVLMERVLLENRGTLATEGRPVPFVNEAADRRRPGHGGVDGVLRELVHRIESAPGTSSKELACEAGMSESSLRRHFKRFVGIPLGRFRTHHRLQLAARLLLTTRDRIHKISSLVGLSDVHYFNKVFRAYFGMSPDAYRKRFQCSRRGPDQKSPAGE